MAEMRQDHALDYQAFMAGKRLFTTKQGIDVALGQLSDILFPFQQQLVQWALRKACCALFCDTGLGKTLMQIEWARQLNMKTLIITPLAVAQQTQREARKLGMEIAYARHQDEATTRVNITNYEMLRHFNPKDFGAVVLDESSILKSIDGKTKAQLIGMFRDTHYRLCCTATPAPNDLSEFANHAEFLGICSRPEMLAMFFVHDDEGWRLKGHAVTEFHRWLASWAMMVKRPSDIGFEDDGFILPQLTVTPEIVDGDASEVAQAQGQLFVTGLHGIKGRLAARKGTIERRIAHAAKLLNGHDQWLVWCGLNEEGRSLMRAVPDALLVEGAQSMETKTQSLLDFVDGKARVMITKPKIAGFGLNLQNCHNIMFLGLNDSYETYYQAVRRCWRFGQKEPVNVHLVISDVELPVWENVLRKERQAEETARHMIENVNEYQMAELGLESMPSLAVADTSAGEQWTLLLGDCVERAKELPDDSVDLSIFSPPFLSLYVYSNDHRDMGNSRTEAEFFGHFCFLLAELLRLTKPGRNVCCHVSQVPATLVNDGFIGLKDFRGRTITAFIEAGFVYHGEVVIDKNPQAQAIRTHSKGLLFAQLRKDASWLRPGLADYILVFRKPGENAIPIEPDISNEDWITWAHPIWYGIRESDTLNVAEARSEKDERHIAPLQLGVIERCIRLWSNKGETVLSPFAGIGSEGYEAVLNGRQFIGIELKPEYYRVAVTNLQRAEERLKQGRLL